MDDQDKFDVDEFEDEALSPLSLENAEDRLIVLHREAHFGGSFDQMVSYYESDGKGAQRDIELRRVRELMLIEKERKIDLLALLLSDSDRQLLKQVQDAYVALKELYEIQKPKNKIPRLLADLILSEDEEPTAEIAAVVAEKDKIVPQLLELLNSESMADPLFPGYGYAPELAARCLALIGDKRAIISLFESIGTGDIGSEECVLAGLHAIGEPAKHFLLGVLRAKPWGWDNVRAATALIRFNADPEVSKAALEMLSEANVFKDLSLAGELLLICEGLQSAQDRELFHSLAKVPTFPKELAFDHAYICKLWLPQKA
jgi:hypothetical protein